MEKEAQNEAGKSHTRQPVLGRCKRFAGSGRIR